MPTAEINLTNSQLALIDAYDKGYRVRDGVLYGGIKSRVRKNVQGYLLFSYRWNSKSFSLLVSRLAAYQKFKSEMFKTGIQVRHLDGNPLNNSYENIVIGTVSENQMDKPKEVRMRCIMTAHNHRGTYDYVLVKDLWESGKNKSDIMKVTGIKTRDTINNIINKPWPKFQTAAECQPIQMETLIPKRSGYAQDAKNIVNMSMMKMMRKRIKRI